MGAAERVAAGWARTLLPCLRSKKYRWKRRRLPRPRGKLAANCAESRWRCRYGSWAWAIISQQPEIYNRALGLNGRTLFVRRLWIKLKLSDRGNYMKHRVTLIPGDGIGPEVTKPTLQIIKAAGVNIDWEPHLAGAEALKKHG